MPLRSRVLAGAGLLAAAAVLGACQGNIGGGSGLSIPQAPGYQQPAGPGASAQSRERVLDGAVYLSPKLTSVPFPQLAGYAVSLELGTPGPLESATPAASPAAAHAPAKKGGKAVRVLAAPHSSAAPSAEPSASASAAPSGSSAAPSAASSASAAASAAAGSAQPKASPVATGASSGASPAASPSGKATGSAAPGPATSGLPRFETKTVVYPDDAPPPPTPMPTGEVQTFVKRVPLVRGYVLAGAELPLYGLGAVHFTLPTTEFAGKRGFTIAVFESGKHRHERLITYDTEPTVSGSIVYSAKTSPPLVFKKGSGYLLLIYGDDEAAPATTPASVPPGYAAPGNNPFPVGSGAPQPGYTQVPGYPGAAGTPYPGSVTPTPVFGPPHQ